MWLNGLSKKSTVSGIPQVTISFPFRPVQLRSSLVC